jgi:orotidine-5'-phosphate decarboxylase
VSSQGGSELRDRLALALDTGDLATARSWAGRLDPWFGILKIGLELFTAAGPGAVDALAAPGRRVFVDLKLFDIPSTVGRAARVAGGLGAAFLTMHTAGGTEMLRAGVNGLSEGAAAAGCPPPVALGVTVLTSEPDASAFPARLQAALAGGCGGVVCSAAEIRAVKAASSALMTVVPGIRLPGGPAHDQARVGDPASAMAAGADVLVIGRAVTAAADPEAVAASLTASLQSLGT